jgi:hypothetical protein
MSSGDVKVTFSWRHGIGAPESIAIIQAVNVGYTSKEGLVSALPMFHLNRLLSGLEKLISADLISVNNSRLVLNSEAVFLDKLTIESISLPINSTEKYLKDEDKSYLFQMLGIKNVAIANNTIKVKLG